MAKITLCLFLIVLCRLDLALSEECGRAHGHVSTIYRGTTVNKGDWPWLTAIFRKTGRSIEFICAGSLVSKSHVVTAAHCLYLPSAERIRSRDLIVYLGKHNLFSGDDKDDTQIRTISEKHIHPRYNHSSSIRDSDIAVIVLENPVTYTNLIKPVCLWESGADPQTGSSTGTAVGWGALNEESDEISELPKFVRMPVVTNEECLESLPYFKTSGIVTDRTICAGKRDGSGTCTGDSGGGLFVVRDDRWILRGIVSKSILNRNTHGCNLYQFAVMTDVYKYITWLHRAIGIESQSSLSSTQSTTAANRVTMAIDVGAAAMFAQRFTTSTVQPSYNVYQQAPPPVPKLPTVLIAGRKYYIGGDVNGRGLSWSDAKKYCKDNDMKLASFETRPENDAMVNYLQSRRITLWIDGTDAGHHNTWVWSHTNSEISYDAWGVGQKGNTDEDCLGINPHEGLKGWHDIPCNVAFKFICEAL